MTLNNIVTIFILLCSVSGYAECKFSFKLSHNSEIILASTHENLNVGNKIDVIVENDKIGELQIESDLFSDETQTLTASYTSAKKPEPVVVKVNFSTDCRES